MTNLRKVERINGEEWEQCKMSDLCEGDMFRVFEPTGEPVKCHEIYTVFRAISPPYVNERNVVTIDVDPAY